MRAPGEGKCSRFVLLVPAHAVMAMVVVAKDLEDLSASRPVATRRLLDPVAGAALVGVAGQTHRPPRVTRRS